MVLVLNIKDNSDAGYPSSVSFDHVFVAITAVIIVNITVIIITIIIIITITIVIVLSKNVATIGGLARRK